MPKLRPFRQKSPSMDAISYKTQVLKPADIQREWWVLDAQGQTLGRMATQIAIILRGKHKPSFTPYLNCGDNVVVINASQVHLTGRKKDQREILHHTGYPGGQRSRTPRQIMARNAAELIEITVKGMLPKNKLGNDLFRNLYVYNGAEHPHTAQTPKELTLTR